MMNNNIFNLVFPIVEKACVAIMDIYNSNDNSVSYKDDDSPLTRADISANEIICNGLKDIDSSIPIISEEGELRAFEIRKEYTDCWLVDPLDGTKEFVSKNGEFTVNIALVRNGEVIFGIVAVPVNEEIYWAKKGNGAYLFKNGQSTLLKVAPFKMDQHGIKVCISRSHLFDETKDFISSLNKPEIIVAGSALKLGLIASGSAFLYPRFGRTMEWDIAAGQIVIEEAGGVVVDMKNKRPLRYNKSELYNPAFFAMGKLV